MSEPARRWVAALMSAAVVALVIIVGTGEAIAIGFWVVVGIGAAFGLWRTRDER